MVVLGIDPGSYRTGWGVVGVEASQMVHLGSGTLRGNGRDLGARLLAIADALEEVFREFTPQAVAVEAVFQAKNSRSAIQLGHARGVALLCAARSGAPVFEYAASQIKQATAGHGRAPKEQVRDTVAFLLRHRSPLALDASDALATAICHLQLHLTPAARHLQAELRRGAGGGRTSAWNRTGG